MKTTNPSFELRHRMSLALEAAGVSVQDMAAELGVSRVTVSAWLHARNRPPIAALKLWAIRTGVSYQWLLTGVTAEMVPTPDPVGAWDGVERRVKVSAEIAGTAFDRRKRSGEVRRNLSYPEMARVA
jgi:transcriptional regulator with XRE-family HTH domain